MHTPEKDKSIVTETISEVCYEERTIPGNNRSEYQVLIQADAEHRRVHQKTTEKWVDMISAQEELQKAREADIARGLVEAEALHGMLAEHKTLGEKHEELSQLQAEQEKGTLKDKDDPKKPAGEDGHFLAEKREEIKRSLLVNHKIPDVIKKAGEMWKSIPTDLRQRFEETYKTAQEEYRR